MIRAEAGGIYASAGQHDRAIAIYRALRAKDPQNFAMPWALGGALIGKGSNEEGLAEYRSAVKVHEGNPQPLAALAFANARAGQKDEARKILAGLRERAQDHGSVLIRMAGAHAVLGEPDEAMACLERLYRERDPAVLWIPTLGGLKPLQSDPRYQDLVRRIGWPGAAKR